VVENYRVAHGIHERARQHQASTEDLREALLRYRSLFEELLRPGDHPAVPAGDRAEVPAASDPAPGDRLIGDGPASDRPARSQRATGVEDPR
jgi:hypothetical protein